MLRQRGHSTFVADHVGRPRALTLTCEEPRVFLVARIGPGAGGENKVWSHSGTRYALVPVARDARAQHVGHDVVAAEGREPDAEVDMMKRLCMQHARGRHVVTLAVLLSTACCAGANRGGGRADLDLADRYERGDGVPRDFRKAADILAHSCAEGRGVPSACRRLAFARARGRGVAVDQSVAPLLTAACERGDWLACGGPIGFDEGKARTACSAGSAEACLAVASLSGYSESGSAQEERWAYIEAACRADVLEGCIAIARTGLDDGDALDDLARERLTSACGRGDVDACEAVGTPLDPRALCAAGDFAACAAAGDPATLKTACDNQQVDACEVLALRALEMEPPGPGAADLVKRACRLGSAAACDYDQPGQVETGCGDAFSVFVIDPDHRRQVARLHGSDANDHPWTAPAERLLITVDNDNVPDRGYDEIAKRAGLPVFVSTTIERMTAARRLERAVLVVIAPSVAREHVASGRHRVADHEIARTTAIVDPDGTVRAVFWGVPKAPVSFARCVRHVVKSL